MDARDDEGSQSQRRSTGGGTRDCGEGRTWWRCHRELRWADAWAWRGWFGCPREREKK